MSDTIFPKTLIDAVRYFADPAVCHESEEWRAVIGFPLYEVSSHGRVRSLPRRVRHGHGWQDLPLKILAPKANQRGYQSVFLSGPNGFKRLYVHRLVLEAFVGPCPLDHECRHFPDGNPANNRLENLSWATHTTNIADRRIHGTAPIGEKKSVKLTDEDVRAIKRRLAAGDSQHSIARDFPVSRSLIQAIKAGKVWSHVSL